MPVQMPVRLRWMCHTGGMNTAEISVWFAQLFQLGEQPEWQEYSAAGHRVASFSSDGRATVVTLDMSTVDTGLRAVAPPEAQNPLSEADIRVELILQTTDAHRDQLQEALGRTLTALSESDSQVTPQPGAILADLMPELSTRPTGSNTAMMSLAVFGPVVSAARNTIQPWAQLPDAFRLQLGKPPVAK